MGSSWARRAAVACTALSILHSGLTLAETILIRVTAPDGAIIHINPTYITKMYSTKEAMDKGPNKYVVTGANCVVTMADTKFVSTKETCDYIMSLIGKKR